MKIRVNGTDFELSKGSIVDFTLNKGTRISFSDGELVIQDEILKLPAPKIIKASRVEEDDFPELGKNAIVNRIMKTIRDNDGRSTAQSLTYAVVGKGAQPKTRNYFKRVLSDLVHAGKVHHMMDNQRGVFTLPIERKENDSHQRP